MRQIEELNILHFRGLENLRLPDLASINIIAGINNCGKTSLLEALKIVQTPYSCENLIKIATSRGVEIKNFKKLIQTIMSLYNQNDKADDPAIAIDFVLSDESFSFESTIDQSQKLDFSSGNIEFENIKSNVLFQDTLRLVTKCKSDRTTKAEYHTYDITEKNVSSIQFGNARSIFDCVYLGTAVSLYSSCTRIISQTILENRKEDFIRTLRYFDSTIIDISILDDDIYIHKKNKPVMPLYTFGAGTQKSLLLVGVLYKSRDGILLIDEIDTGLHLSVFDEVFSSLIKLSKRLNVQLFITTHSIECIDSLISCSNNLGLENETRMITLKKGSSETLSRILGGKEALLSRDNYHIELRQ